MVTKITRNHTYKCFVVLICLLIVGNSTNGVVLCFGVDGHIKIESAFHERCNDHGHSQPTDQEQLSYQLDHGNDKHCEPCIDVPVSIGLAKITRVSKQLNPTFPAPAANVIILANKFNHSAYNSASNSLDATSYFAPLRAVVLLI